MARSVRRQRHNLAEQLRGEGQTWEDIAEAIRDQWPELTPRQAMRHAHRESQSQVLMRWEARFSGGTMPPEQRVRRPEDRELGRWEYWPGPGGVAPSWANLDRLAHIYQCSVAYLVSDISDYRHLDRAGDGPRLPTGLRGGEDDVQRRDMLKLVATAAAAVTVEPQLVADVLDTHPADRFEERRRSLIDSDNLLGPHHAIPVARDQLDAIQTLRARTRGADKDRLLDVQIEYADFLGWLYQDAGEHPAAQYWLDRALEWSHLSGDSDTTAFVMARKSQLASDTGRPEDAVEVGHAALDLAQPGSRIFATAAVHTGHGHALCGDGAASARCYEAAAEHVDDSDSSYGLFLDSAYVRAYEAHSLTVSGDHSRALDLFSSGVTQPGYYRDGGVYVARWAIAQAGVGDIESASANGLRALRVQSETRSHRIAVLLHRLTRLLDGQGTDTELQAVMAELKGTSE